VNPEDVSLYRVVDTVDDAVREITTFYRVFHSSRIVNDVLVFRLTKKLEDRQIAELQQAFEDILKGPVEQASGPISHELNEFPELPRLIVPFNRAGYGRLRLLIDHLNTF
jgi:hypothetical protein